MSLSTQIKKAAEKSSKRKTPVWKGPEEDGITFSLLSRFLVCRERFRLLVVEGLQPAEAWNHKTGFGNIWHVAEEAFAADKRGLCGEWQARIAEHAKDACKRFPLQQDEISNWHDICRTMFPIYTVHWQRHPDVLERTPLLQEQTFEVPYPLPSGRAVKLRGKWDSVDLIGKGKGAGIYLQENKTKQRIDERQVKRQLSFDLQTMLYLVALGEDETDRLKGAKYPILGVRYNVVRRPAQYRGKKETQQDFLARLKGMIESSPGDFFMRWKVEVSPGDVARFRRECLDPILEQLCDWWEFVSKAREVPWDGVLHGVGSFLHFRMPYGVYNPLLEGGISDLDEHLSTGTTVGLRRTENLFPELTEAT